MNKLDDDIRKELDNIEGTAMEKLCRRTKMLQRCLDERRWIPVSERLPKDNGYCMIFNGSVTNTVYTRQDGFIDSYPVTHWMQLPDAPKEQP